MSKFPKEIKRSKLIKDLDDFMSAYIKKLQHYICQRCGKKYLFKSRALTCSHYFSRRYLGTRWDWLNLDSMCYGCHRMIEGDKQGWYKDFMVKKLGRNGFKRLEVKAYAITKYSRQDLELMLDLFESNIKGKII